MAPVQVESLNGLHNLVGRELPPTEWFTMTQERIQQFAEATEDRQWIHLDAERARKESPYGTTIAHGFLTLSLLSFFMKQVIQIQAGVRLSVNYGLNRVRFPAPVQSNARIRARAILLTLKELPDAVEAVFAVTIESEGGEKPCCIAEWVIRHYR
jgi:acyl dehydratase